MLAFLFYPIKKDKIHDWDWKRSFLSMKVKVLYGIVSIYECRGVIFDTRLKLFIGFIRLSWDFVAKATFPPVSNG